MVVSGCFMTTQLPKICTKTFAKHKEKIHAFNSVNVLANLDW